MKLRSVRLIISGDVQGVGYRGWIKSVATHFGLAGWAKNRPDGAVEVVLQGDGEAILKCIEKSKDGPLTASVDGVATTDIPYDSTINDFQVLY